MVIRLSRPMRSMRDSAETAALKGYLVRLEEELEYAFSLLEEKRGTERDPYEDRLETLEKLVARAVIQTGRVSVTASGAGNLAKTVTLDRAYQGINGYVVLPALELDPSGQSRVTAANSTGQTFQIKFAVTAAGTYTASWIAVGK